MNILKVTAVSGPRHSRLQVDPLHAGQSDLTVGVPLVALPDVWCYGVSTRIGWPDVSML